jgi:hypothetical protein
VSLRTLVARFSVRRLLAGPAAWWAMLSVVQGAVMVSCSAKVPNPAGPTMGADAARETSAPTVDAGFVDEDASPGDAFVTAPESGAVDDDVVDVAQEIADAPLEVASEAETAPEAEAGCTFEVASPPLLAGVHVPIGSVIEWDSNPPSSGPHYPVWAAYQLYTSPVPRGYYVHDLEHGAIVFLYNCGDAGCPDVVAALQQAADTLPDDPLCTAAGEGVRVRTIITPDPLLDVPVAAAGWGFTFKAPCMDSASLVALESFAAAHYGNGPETFCANGTTQF